MKHINLLLSSLLLGGVIINCGGGGGSNVYDNDEKEEAKIVSSPSLVKLKGIIADGYIMQSNVEVRYSNIKVKIDSNNNGEYIQNKTGYQDESVKTDSNNNGEYIVSLPSTAKRINVFASGGIDTDTSELFEGVVRSSFILGDNTDKIWTTPITSLVALLINDGKSDNEAREIINTHLGLKSSLDLLKTNPMSETLDSNTKIKLFKATQQIQRVSEIIKDVIGNDISYNDISKAIARAIASDNGSNNIISILKSSSFNDNVIALLSDDKKDKALKRLNDTQVAINSIVDLIDKENISLDKIKLYSKSIEIVSNSYEIIANSISRSINDDKLVEFKTNLENMVKTYTSLSEVNVLVLKAQALALANDKMVSYRSLSRSIVKIISDEDTVSELSSIHTKINISDSVITDEEKKIFNAKITAGIADTPIITSKKTPEKKTNPNETIKTGSAQGGNNSDNINKKNSTGVPNIPSDFAPNSSSKSLADNNKQPEYNSESVPNNQRENPPTMDNNNVPNL
jgi:hypothetical protein